jgi:hypothetical protein
MSHGSLLLDQRVARWLTHSLVLLTAGCVCVDHGIDIRMTLPESAVPQSTLRVEIDMVEWGTKYSKDSACIPSCPGDGWCDEVAYQQGRIDCMFGAFEPNGFEDKPAKVTVILGEGSGREVYRFSKKLDPYRPSGEDCDAYRMNGSIKAEWRVEGSGG